MNIPSADVNFAKHFSVHPMGNPLFSIPRYQAKGIVHPDVLPMEEKNFLMVYTPYPPEEKENPCLVYSSDLIHWRDESVSNPLLTPDSNVWWKNWHLADPDLLFVPEHKRWYLFFQPRSRQGTKDPYGKDVSRQCFIAVAVSNDGILFDDSSDNPILISSFPHEGIEVRGPSVLWNSREQQFEMYYDSRDLHSGRYVINRAISRGGINWNKDIRNPLISFPDKDIWHPCVRFFSDSYWMYVPVGRVKSQSNYGDIWLFTSKDGVAWKSQGIVICHSLFPWMARTAYRSSFILLEDRIHLFVSGFDKQGIGHIGYFISAKKGKAVDFAFGGKVIL
ncbi:hypothetical protein L1765_04820 [Microaerobacter geothermalis]|uniref:hypothetical protein n=1 Tax=Microaerobacter geothermalis TaxID=674972 RepID=UPI001F323A5E|nr:hypothetical protein [Microaerobacter geothermalis]MCF6093318.1 hypothetical protein [Microaerobacter geothermalis]